MDALNHFVAIRRCMAAWAWCLVAVMGCLVGPASAGSAVPEAGAAPGAAPITLLRGELDERGMKTQALAVAHPGLWTLVRDQVGGVPLRTEVFAVYPARATDVPEGRSCPEGDCYRVDIYSFAHNVTVSMLVDTGREIIVGNVRQNGARAELPVYLVERAIEIARSDPEVIAALGL